MDYNAELPADGFKTREWAKKRYNISNSTLHKWQAEGIFPKSFKIGPRAVRFRVEDLREYEAKIIAKAEEGR